MRTVDLFNYLVRIERGKVAGPAAAGVEFRVGGEQRCVTADAMVDAVLVVIPVFAGEGPFGRCVPGYLVLDGVELVAPFGFGFLDFFG